jgi:hypothetical protein
LEEGGRDLFALELHGHDGLVYCEEEGVQGALVDEKLLGVGVGVSWWVDSVGGHMGCLLDGIVEETIKVEL